MRLEKRRKREVPFLADWVGFKIADEFVIGYGLDLDGRYRNLKQVRVWQNKSIANSRQTGNLRPKFSREVESAQNRLLFKYEREYQT